MLEALCDLGMGQEIRDQGHVDAPVLSHLVNSASILELRGVSAVWRRQRRGEECHLRGTMWERGDGDVRMLV